MNFNAAEPHAWRISDVGLRSDAHRTSLPKLFAVRSFTNYASLESTKSPDLGFSSTVALRCSAAIPNCTQACGSLTADLSGWHILGEKLQSALTVPKKCQSALLVDLSEASLVRLANNDCNS